MSRARLQTPLHRPRTARLGSPGTMQPSRRHSIITGVAVLAMQAERRIACRIAGWLTPRPLGVAAFLILRIDCKWRSLDSRGRGKAMRSRSSPCSTSNS